MMNRKNPETELTDLSLKICLDVSPVGIVVFGCDSRVFYTNQLAEQLFGRKASKLSSFKCGEFIGCKNRHLDQRGCGHTTTCPICPLFRAICKVCDPNSSEPIAQEGEAYLDREPGHSAIWIKFKANGILLDGQRAVIMAFDDITSHKRNEDQLHNTLAELAAIHENAPIAMVLLDRDRRVRKVNGCAVDFANRPAKEMIGLLGGEALRCLNHLEHPKGCGFGSACATACKVRETVLATFEMQTSQTEIEAWLPFDRLSLTDKRCLLINTSYLFLNGSGHVLLCAQDITARKRSEEQLKVYQKIVSSIPDRVAFVDNNYKYIIANKAYESFSDISPEKLAGSKVAENLGEEVFQKTIKPQLDKCLQGEMVKYQHLFHYPKVGERFMDVSYFPYRDTHNNITGIVSFIRDVTERKTSEETIQRSEERYHTIINASPLAIFLIRNGQYHYANPAARRMLGYPLDSDISTVSIDQTIAPAQLTHIRQRINARDTDIANPPIEVTIIKADGSSTVTESISIPIQLEDGPAILAMGIDINDRKKSADLLKARLRLSEASTFLDLNSLLTMALDEVEILTGSQIGFFHLFDEDQKAISLHAWSTSTAQTFCKAEGTGSHYKLEVAGVWADCIRERKIIVHNDYSGLPHRKGLPNGHAVVMRELVVPVFRNNRIMAILGVGNKIEEYNEKDIDLVSNLANMAWDIVLRKRAETALRESEEKHRFLIENSHDIIYTLNADGVITFISPSWTNLLGHPVTQVIDKSFDTFIHPEDHAAWMTRHQEVIMTGKRQEGIEYRMQHIDGSWHWHTSNIVPLWNEAGVINGIEGIARDITDRKRVEAVVKESEAKYRSAFTLMRRLCDNVPDMIWAKDIEGRYLFVNKAICRNMLNAADTDEPIGKSDRFFAERERTRHADNPNWHTLGERCRDTDAIAMDAFTSQQFDEYGYVQGGFLYLDVHKAPFLDENGKIIGTVGSARDVTKAKFMEQKLRDSEEQFRSLYDSSLDAILLTVPDGRIIAANSSACKLLQRTEEEIKQVGQNGILDTSDLRLNLFVEDRNRTGKVHSELTCIRKNGAKFPVEVSSSVYQDKDGNVLASVIFRDITDRKQAEQALRLSEVQFRRLFAQNSATMLMIDPCTGEIIEANQAAANFYGWSIEELKQMRIQDINTLPAENVESLMEKTRLSGSLRLEFRHRRADGSIRDVEVFSSRIELTEKVFLYSIIHDITERKQAEEALQFSLAEKEVLLREVHHRVKNNMAAIIGLFHLQRQAMDDPQVQTVLTELSSRVRSMSLVHEKLYRSNSLTRIDFQDYIQSLTSHLRTSFGSPRIRCEIDSAGVKMSLDLAVPCGMIINELITNALKYAFPKEWSGASDRVDRILIAMSHDENIFSLSVADNGVGLPPGFDLNEAKTLGLVLVRMLGQHQLGGRFRIDQIGGTRFTLTFPRHGRKHLE